MQSFILVLIVLDPLSCKKKSKALKKTQITFDLVEKQFKPLDHAVFHLAQHLLHHLDICVEFVSEHEDLKQKLSASRKDGIHTFYASV